MADTSYIKRNKTFLSRIVKILKKREDIKRYYTIHYKDKVNDFDVPLEIVVHLKTDIVLVEEKDKVYIAQSLSNPRILLLTKSSIEDLVLREIGTVLSYSRRNRNFHDYISNVVGIYSYDEKAIRDSDMFKEIVDYFYDVILNAEVSVELRDGEWPKLSNRKVLPIGIIDKNEGMMDYSDEYWGVASYRKNRKKTYLMGYEFENALRQMVINSPMISLIDIDIRYNGARVY